MNLPWLSDIQQQLNDALLGQRLGHAPLIQGPSGVGKRQLGDWLSRRILCLATEGPDPCGQCRSCQLFASASHPDFFDVGIPEEKREIPVDSIRELNGRLQLTSSLSDRRVGRILPAEAMNVNAANALLKTLEEPASKAWLLLVSDRPGRLPATIRSRCQAITVRPPAHAEALDWLRSEVSARALPVADDAVEHALELAGDAPLAALGLLEGDGMRFGLDLRKGLIRMARGEGLQDALDPGWAEQPETTWRWLAIWSGLILRASLDAGENPGLLGDLPDDLHPETAARLWDSALQGNALARGNARQDLLLGKWLLEWQQVCHSRT
jgi:DNA polymerase-3 subunit delta'